MSEEVKATEEVSVVEQKTNGKNRAVVKTKKPPANITMETVLFEAVQRGMDADAMEKLVGLVERRENRVAENEFNEALAKAQSEMKPVLPNGFNQQTSSEYPKLEEVNTMAMPIATKNGFSISCTQGKTEIEGHLRIEGTLSHSSGHSRDYYVDLPLDQTGIKGTVNKTLIHATGSTFTYGRRYLAIMIFNISILGVDDDGQASGKIEGKPEESGNLITKNNVKKIEAMIGKDEALKQLVLDKFGIALYAQIEKKDFKDCITSIEKYKVANK